MVWTLCHFCINIQFGVRKRATCKWCWSWRFCKIVCGCVFFSLSLFFFFREVSCCCRWRSVCGSSGGLTSFFSLLRAFRKTLKPCLAKTCVPLQRCLVESQSLSAADWPYNIMEDIKSASQCCHYSLPLHLSCYFCRLFRPPISLLSLFQDLRWISKSWDCRTNYAYIPPPSFILLFRANQHVLPDSKGVYISEPG